MSLFTASKLSYLHSHYFSHPVTRPSCRCPALLVRTVEFEDTIKAPYFPFPSSVAQTISPFVADPVYRARKANSLTDQVLKFKYGNKQTNKPPENKQTKKTQQSSPDATVEQACNGVYLRALYLLADFGGDHSTDWDGRTLQGDKQKPTLFF